MWDSRESHGRDEKWWKVCHISFSSLHWWFRIQQRRNTWSTRYSWGSFHPTSLFWISCMQKYPKLSINYCTATEYITSVIFRKTHKWHYAGMTTGKSVTTPDGEIRRVFLDLVGINSLLDVIVHFGNAYCHKWTFRTSTKTLGNNHYLDGRAHSFSTAFRRTISRDLDVRNMDVLANVLRKLDMKANPDVCNTLLVDLAKTIYSEEDSIRLTSNNQRLLSCALYPYAGSHIAPEHLLCGLFRDYLTVAYLCCGSPLLALSFERKCLFLLSTYKSSLQ